MIIEVADTVFTGEKYIKLAGLIQKLAITHGFYLETRHINFINTKNMIEAQDHGFNANYTATKDAHSNCHQILVFNKSKVKTTTGETLYINYKKSTEHPCPEPAELTKFILNNYYKSGMHVLDPFMGIANFGLEVIKRHGNFWGYEIVKKFFNTATKKLKQY